MTNLTEQLAAMRTLIEAGWGRDFYSEPGQYSLISAAAMAVYGVVTGDNLLAARDCAPMAALAAQIKTDAALAYADEPTADADPFGMIALHQSKPSPRPHEIVHMWDDQVAMDKFEVLALIDRTITARTVEGEDA
jgi:hypothetical protein